VKVVVGMAEEELVIDLPVEGIPEAQELDAQVRDIQAAATQEKTMRSYTSCMNQMERFINRDVEPRLQRRIFKEYTLNGGALVDGEDVVPLTCTEILRFLAHKRNSSPNMKKNSLASFKSAALKYRILNGFPPFSDQDDNELHRFLKGVANQLSNRVRDGDASSEEGKRHLKFKEYLELCRRALQDKLATLSPV
jgi:hypothetical protein